MNCSSRRWVPTLAPSQGPSLLLADSHLSPCRGSLPPSVVPVFPQLDESSRCARLLSSARAGGGEPGAVPHTTGVSRSPGVSSWITGAPSPTEEPGSQLGLTRCGLVAGPDEILGLHHDHGEAFGRGEVAEGQQDLAHRVGGLQGGQVA